MVDKAQDVALEKLPDASAAQASIIAASDKGRLLLNQPTSITGKAQSIADLAKAFNHIANENIVSVQTKNDETDETEEIE